jgi:hypothetical protein
LLLAALVAVLVAPVGFALTLESVPALAQTFHPAAPMAAAVTAPVIVHVRDSSASVPQWGLDAAGLLIIGTALFGLAAVVRRAV